MFTSTLNFLVILQNTAEEARDTPSDLPKQTMKVPARKGRRVSVSAESYDPSKDTSDAESKIPSHPKTDDEMARLKEAMGNAFLFRSLDPDQSHKVAMALVPQDFKAGETVITEGEEVANHFYVVEKGILDCFKKNSSTGQNEKVFEYDNSGAFGELALLYNQPRAATVTARTDSKLWALDRATFQLIVVRAAYKKRQLYMEIMNKIDFLSELTEYERQNVCDALQAKYYNDGDVILRQGDAADGLYFMEAGRVRAYRRDTPDAEETEVGQAEPGGYFGELALITDSPRAATVRADGKVKAAFLDTAAFERLCGPGLDVMKRNISKYEEQLNSLGLKGLNLKK